MNLTTLPASLYLPLRPLSLAARASRFHPAPPTTYSLLLLSTRSLAVSAIGALNDRSGVSLPQMKAYFSSNKKGFKNHMLLKALKTGVANGTLAMHHQKKGSYKLGAPAPKPKKKKVVKKKKAAPKKKKKATYVSLTHSLSTRFGVG